MLWGTVREKPGTSLLLPGPLRAAGAWLLAACVATVLVAFAVGRVRPGRLDTTVDTRIAAGLSHFPELLDWLPHLGTLGPVALMTLALAVAYAATRRWSGAVLTVVAVPAAIALTEYVLKPYVGARMGQSFPSGHATSSFALAVIFAVLLADRPRHLFRLLLVLLALLLAAAVAAAMIAIGAHTFTDAIAGAAVGTGVVLACALILDLVTTRVRRAWADRSEPDEGCAPTEPMARRPASGSSLRGRRGGQDPPSLGGKLLGQHQHIAVRRQAGASPRS
jgi:membrane-associated phospholipid phosphatase